MTTVQPNWQCPACHGWVRVPEAAHLKTCKKTPEALRRYQEDYERGCTSEAFKKAIKANAAKKASEARAFAESEKITRQAGKR